MMKQAFCLLTVLLTAAMTLMAQHRPTEAGPALRSAEELTIKTAIDSIYVFGFDLRQSRSAKGGIWDLRTLEPVTPQNYTNIQRDTIGGQPVVRLYREVVRGNHPLNGWETWRLSEDRWISVDNGPGSDDTRPEVR